MPRSIYKAAIVFGDVRVPVKLYAAVESRDVSFHLLHAPDSVPVRQRMVHSVTGKPVPDEEVCKGYRINDNTFVLLRSDELAQLEPTASRDVVIQRFVDSAHVDSQWYTRPYYLGPDGDSGSYLALADALAASGKVGIARWVMRKKQYVGALSTHRGYLVLVAMQHAEEVVTVPALSPSAERAPDPKEKNLAEQLVSALAGPFEPESYHDEHRQRLLELIEAKSRGKRIRFTRPAPRKAVPSLSDALKRSIRVAKEQKVA